MKTITLRLDDESEAALANLILASGSDQSKVLRTLITDAERERVLTQAKAEARALRDNPDYQAEVRALDEVMEPLSAR